MVEEMRQLQRQLMDIEVRSLNREAEVVESLRAELELANIGRAELARKAADGDAALAAEVRRREAAERAVAAAHADYAAQLTRLGDEVGELCDALAAAQGDAAAARQGYEVELAVRDETLDALKERVATLNVAHVAVGGRGSQSPSRQPSPAHHPHDATLEAASRSHYSAADAVNRTAHSVASRAPTAHDVSRQQHYAPPPPQYAAPQPQYAQQQPQQHVPQHAVDVSLSEDSIASLWHRLQHYGDQHAGGPSADASRLTVKSGSGKKRAPSSSVAPKRGPQSSLRPRPTNVPLTATRTKR
jgi:hypothetical protein